MPESDKVLVIPLPATLHAAVKEKAAAEDRSMSSLVRNVLREYVGAVA